jgi:hypothetical protein
MRAKHAPSSFIVVGAALMIAAPALAQEERGAMRRVEAPRRAVELTLGTGYVQGFGRTASDKAPQLSDFAGAGLGVTTGVGFRINPMVTLGATLGYQSYARGSDSSASDAPQGLYAGVDATAHFRPYDLVHPYLQLGSGYRFLWNGGQINRGDFALHGFELARVALVIDLQTSRYFAIGPSASFALDMFAWDAADARRSSQLDRPRIDPFVTAGLQGRFDIPVTREHVRTTAAR